MKLVTRQFHWVRALRKSNEKIRVSLPLTTRDPTTNRQTTLGGAVFLKSFPCRSPMVAGTFTPAKRCPNDREDTLAKDMHSNARVSVADTTLVLSTGAANLFLVKSSVPGFSDQAPLLLLPGPTEQDARYAIQMATKLSQLHSQFAPDIYLMKWKSFWPTQGQVRFAPLVRDLSEVFNFLHKTAPAPHLMTLGHGALLPMRAADGFGLDAKSGSLPSISFWAPRLEVRKQGTRLRNINLSRKISVITHETDMRPPTDPLFKRLPPTLVERFEIENEHWFVWSQISTDPDLSTVPRPCGFAGNWLRSWLDWLLCNRYTN